MTDYPLGENISGNDWETLESLVKSNVFSAGDNIIHGDNIILADNIIRIIGNSVKTNGNAII